MAITYASRWVREFLRKQEPIPSSNPNIVYIPYRYTVRGTKDPEIIYRKVWGICREDLGTFRAIEDCIERSAPALSFGEAKSLGGMISYWVRMVSKIEKEQGRKSPVRIGATNFLLVGRKEKDEDEPSVYFFLPIKTYIIIEDPDFLPQLRKWGFISRQIKRIEEMFNEGAKRVALTILLDKNGPRIIQYTSYR